MVCYFECEKMSFARWQALKLFQKMLAFGKSLILISK